MKLLLTGATGFIGKNLAMRLIKEGHQITALTRKSTNPEMLPKGIEQYTFKTSTKDLALYMRKEKFDGVIHLASLFIAEHSNDTLKDLIDSNVFLGTAVLDATAQNSTPWFLNTGTFWQHHNNKSYSPVNLYAATKQAFEDISKFYSETSETTIVTIKLCDTFGPHDTRKKIFNLWLQAAQSNTPIEMSAGEQLINICYIDDVVDGYIAMIKQLQQKNRSRLNGKSYAISSPTVVSLKKLATIFQKASGLPLTILWGKRPYRKREVMIPWTKGKLVPGWKPKNSLLQGIQKTLQAL